MIDWCLMPTLAIFQLYHGMKKLNVNLDTDFEEKLDILKQINLLVLYGFIILAYFNVYCCNDWLKTYITQLVLYGFIILACCNVHCCNDWFKTLHNSY